MHRRGYLAAVATLAGTSIAGCPVGRREDDEGWTYRENSTLSTSEHTAWLSEFRVRASIPYINAERYVYDEPDTQFLVFEVSTVETQLDELPLSLHADGSTVATDLISVAAPPKNFEAVLAFPVPHDHYKSVDIVLDQDGESVRLPVESELVDALGSPPDFAVESLNVPERIPEVQPFQATFTVSNSGGREGRFLAEFGHGLVVVAPIVELQVPSNATRTYEKSIEVSTGDYESIPVVLDWSLDSREAEVVVESGE